jgi:exopolyphosphatase/guanosine-5'-triphosphate,3'-diphosphate pyrophosphatase
VPLVLVRHARSAKRASFAGAGGARPLSQAGREQAEGLIDLLRDEEIRSLWCGPALRCRQTLEAVAAERGLEIRVDDRLDEDAPLAVAERLAAQLRLESAVICSHRSLVLGIARRLLGAGAASDLEDRCEKGSVWMIEGSPARGSYFSPRRNGRGLKRAESTSVASHRLRVRRKHRGAPGRIAILDLGSTSFHLLVAEPDSDGGVRRIARERVMLRMGTELAKDGRISSAFAERAVETSADLRRAAASWKAQEIVVVGTAALRQARNGASVASALEDAIGAPVQVLSGEEEARLIFRAICHRLDVGSETLLGLDLGGGSLELAVGNRRRIRHESTLPVGVARLHGELVQADPPDPEALRTARWRVREILEPEREVVAGLAPRSCVAVGGTVRAAARILIAEGSERARSARGLFVSRARLGELGRRLAALPSEERLHVPGMNPRRVDLLPVGIEILCTALTRLGLDGFSVCDWGLREGVALEVWGRRAF